MVFQGPVKKPQPDGMSHRGGSGGGGAIISIPGSHQTNVLQDTGGSKPLPLGNALADTTLKVVGADGAEVSHCGSGEVCVGGRLRGTFMAGDGGVYDGAKYRRTGDQAVVRSGEVYLQGRRCFSIKILGQAVQLEQTEAVISSLPGVRCCCVLAMPVAGSHVLAAAVVGDAASGSGMSPCPGLQPHLPRLSPMHRRRT